MTVYVISFEDHSVSGSYKNQVLLSCKYKQTYKNLTLALVAMRTWECCLPPPCGHLDPKAERHVTIHQPFISSVSVYHGLLHTTHFLKKSNLEQSCLDTFITHFHFHSVFNIQNRTWQYLCMNYIDNACMYKFLQDSARFFRFLVLYLQNVWGSMISNMTYAYD